MDKIPVAHVKAIQTNLSIDPASWTEAKVSTTALDGRKWVQLFNRSGYNIWYSYDDSLTVANSFVLRSGGMVILPLSESVSVYLRGTKGLQKVIVAEVS